MDSIYWDVDPRDWEHTHDSNASAHISRVVSEVKAQTRPGSIVLSHDNDQPNTITAYQYLLPWLQECFTLEGLPTSGDCDQPGAAVCGHSPSSGTAPSRCRTPTEVRDDTRTAILTGSGAQLGALLEHHHAERFAAELDRTRNEYAALVGHEVRTPLTTIQSYTDLLLDDPSLPDEHWDMLRAMHRNAGLLAAITGKYAAGPWTWHRSRG